MRCACPIADACGLVCSARDERKALYDKLVAQTYAAGKALKYAEMFEGATERRLFANGLPVLTFVLVWRSGRRDRSGRHAVLDCPGPGVVPTLRHMAGAWPRCLQKSPPFCLSDCVAGQTREHKKRYVDTW